MCTQLLPQTQWMCLGKLCTIIIFFGLMCVVCVCVSIYVLMYKHLNDTNKVIRTLCSNFILTLVARLTTAPVSCELKSFTSELHSDLSTRCSYSSFWMCCFDGQKWFTHFLIPFLSFSCSSRRLLEHDSVNGCYIISLYYLCRFLVLKF